MGAFTEFLEEGLRKTLHTFDMDHTLVEPPSNVQVHINKGGRRVRSLDAKKYNTYKLQPGESHDFSDFKKARLMQHAHPIHKIINRMNTLRRRGFKTEILTARADMDDKNEFGKHLGRMGIDIDKTHVRRSGNVEGTSTGDRKRRVLSDLIKKHGYKEVHLYDDDLGNHEHFAKLKQDHPGVRLISHIVSHNPHTGETSVRTIRH